MEKWISVRSLLSIEIIHEFPSRSIDFVLSLPQANLDVGVLVELLLLMIFDGNRGEWLLKLNQSLYEINQASENLFGSLKLV